MKVRVPGRQLAAAAQETPRASKSGRKYSVYYNVTHFDLLLFILGNENKVGNTQKERRRGSPGGKAPNFQGGR